MCNLIFVNKKFYLDFYETKYNFNSVYNDYLFNVLSKKCIYSCVRSLCMLDNNISNTVILDATLKLRAIEYGVKSLIDLDIFNDSGYCGNVIIPLYLACSNYTKKDILELYDFLILNNINEKLYKTYDGIVSYLELFFQLNPLEYDSECSYENLFDLVQSSNEECDFKRIIIRLFDKLFFIKSLFNSSYGICNDIEKIYDFNNLKELSDILELKINNCKNVYYYNTIKILLEFIYDLIKKLYNNDDNIVTHIDNLCRSICSSL